MGCYMYLLAQVEEIDSEVEKISVRLIHGLGRD